MGKLIIVPTPIGNLGDITLRALDVLRESKLILAEDTRQSGKLLRHYDIQTPMRPYHKFNEHKLSGQVAAELEATNDVYSLISDAGMPGISDPAYLVVRKCLDQNVAVECLPGATAFLPALIKSGLPNDRFSFEGFLPHKKGRTKRLKHLVDEERTMIFYESPHRVRKTLEQFADYFGEERQASVSRELTKVYEETINNHLGALVQRMKDVSLKGEFVIIVDGKK